MNLKKSKNETVVVIAKSVKLVPCPKCGHLVKKDITASYVWSIVLGLQTGQPVIVQTRPSNVGTAMHIMNIFNDLGFPNKRRGEVMVKNSATGESLTVIEFEITKKQKAII